MRAQELESQAQEHRDKLKEVQKELEHTKTQLEFKVSIMSWLIIWSRTNGRTALSPCELETQSESCLQNSCKCQYNCCEASVQGPAYINSFPQVLC
jgi:hypothetical protein